MTPELDADIPDPIELEAERGTPLELDAEMTTTFQAGIGDIIDQDYSPTPDSSVILGAGEKYQTFKCEVGGLLKKVALALYRSAGYTYWGGIEIYTCGEDGWPLEYLGYVEFDGAILPTEIGIFTEFDFSAQGITLTAGQQYAIGVYAGNQILQWISWSSKNGDGYTAGKAGWYDDGSIPGHWVELMLDFLFKTYTPDPDKFVMDVDADMEE